MEHKRYKPLVDKLYWMILIPTAILIVGMTVVASFSPIVLFVTITVDLAVVYLLVSPLFGYVELREKSVYIKYGLLLEKEISYDKIRGITKERKIYSDSMISLKNSLDHVNIKYNTFDIASVSVVENDAFMEELNNLI